MLACIACSAKEGGEDGSRAVATPHGKDAVKSLTSQLKDMVLKFSGSNRQYKSAGSPSFKGKSFHHQPSRLASYPCIVDDSCLTSDVRAGEAYAYRRTMATTSASASSASSAWDVAKINSGWQQNGRSPGASWIPTIEEEADDEVVVMEDSGVPREWTAQVEPGVQITFVSLAGGSGNDLKRIRFSREMFNKWEAQRWWGENYDRIVELYNVQTFSRQQGLSTSTSSVDDTMLRESPYSYSRAGSMRESPVILPSTSASREPITRTTSCKAMPVPTATAPYPASSAARAPYYQSTAVPDPSDHVWAHHFNLLNSAAASSGGAPSFDPSRATASSRDEASVSISNASDMEATEWIEQDEPGVSITIRELADGTRELRRVRFSRERFGEERAKVWWEQNRDRIHAQYL